MKKFDVDAIRAQYAVSDIVGKKVKLKKDGREYKACCPFHQEKTPSFTVNDDKGFYHCFGCGAHGDVIDFIVEHDGLSFKEACELLTGGDGGQTSGKEIKKRQVQKYDPYENYKPIPVPSYAGIITAGSTTPPIWNPKRDGRESTYRPAAVYEYRNSQGELESVVLRVEFENGKKVTPHLMWCRREPDGAEGWCHYPAPEPRSIYGLELLIDPKAPVLIVEGEKCAGAARRVLPQYKGVSWCGGSSAVNKTDWSPLKGRKILIWPDNDEAGDKATSELVDILLPIAEEIKTIERDGTKPKGWDIADAEEMPRKELLAFIKPRIRLHEKPEAPKPLAPVVPKTPVEEGVSFCDLKDFQGIWVPLGGKPPHTQAAETIAIGLKNHLKFDTVSQGWHRYNNRHWQPAHDTEVSYGIKTICKECTGNPFEAGFTRSYVKNVIDCLKDELYCEGFNRTRELIPLNNGILELSNRNFRPHSPEDNINWCLPFDYDEHAECPITKKFIFEILSRGDKSLARVFQAWINAVLCGRVDLQKYMELIGTAGAGKSTFIDLCEDLVGSKNKVSTELKQLEENRFETSSLYGKRLAVISDSAKHGGGLSTLKAITGQDSLRMEEKHKSRTGDFKAECLVLIASNEPIATNDHTGGITRRRISVLFDKAVKEGDSKYIPNLKQELRNELAGTFNWALELTDDEVREILTKASQQSETIEDMQLEMIVETNPIAAWADDCIYHRRGSEIGVNELYASYKQFTLESGGKPKARRNFLRDFEDLSRTQLGYKDVESYRGGDGRHWKVRGVAMLGDFSPSDASSYVKREEFIGGGGWQATATEF